MLGVVDLIRIGVLRAEPGRDRAFNERIEVALHAGVLHQLDVRREHEHPLVADRAGVGPGIVENPLELHVSHVRSRERHGELRLIAHRVADGAELGPSVEVHRLDDQRVAVPPTA